MARPVAKPKLSKLILEMKFMKKTKEKVDKELENTDGHEMYSADITNEMRSATGNFIMEPSFVACENLLEGRLSFRGINPEIEKLMEEENLKKNPIAAKETDISDKELAATFKRKNENDHNYSPRGTKRKYIKPSED